MTIICWAMGIMINGSFVFGMDDDEPDAFRRTLQTIAAGARAMIAGDDQAAQQA